MREYVVYIILSVVCVVMCTMCLCENDDDNIIFTSNGDIEPQITDEESQEGDSDIMIVVDDRGVKVDDGGLKVDDVRFKVDDVRFSEFYGDRDNIRGNGEI
jgi:hypothetical protein